MEFPFERRKYEILKRAEEKTNPAWGKAPEQRTIQELLDYGLIILNKPAGPTSHQVVDFVKKILSLEKAGHSGTLDPNVTGVLVITLGKATRVVEVLLTGGKEYICLMHIHAAVEEDLIRKTFKEYLGKIEQMPPKKSAVKRQLRTREIYYLEILEIEGQDVLFLVGCEAGTYIRTLCVGLGKKLNCKAHMQELVRSKVCSFTDKQWHSLHDLKDAYEDYKEGNDHALKQIILPFETAVAHLPKIWISDFAIDSIAHGAFLSVPGIVKLESDIELGNTVALLSLKGELIGIGQTKMNSQNMWKQEKGVAMGETKVFMEPGVYPKYKKNEEKE
ncbi:MAG: RNA-guided pseudouridylation complex pseudouridine synthase subunit Cbf5 [bacterium]|nr:RNA-guided pseudouridylation complex pseudouridine synthase subunit Cbf5 [bacterium]